MAIASLRRCSSAAGLAGAATFGYPFLRQLVWILLYAALLLAGVRLYQAGLAYSADGSGFGRQLLSIVASATCLLSAALFASQTSSASLTRLPGNAVPARSKDDDVEGEPLLPFAQRPTTTENDEVRSRCIYVAVEDGGGSSSGTSRRVADLSDATLRLLALLWVLLPLLTPLFLSTYVLLRANADGGTTLSAEVTALLFSSVGLAMMLAGLLVYLSCARRQGRAVGWTLLLVMVAMISYLVSSLRAYTNMCLHVRETAAATTLLIGSAVAVV